MYLTLFGVVLGGLFSWIITHEYHKNALKRSAQSDPIPLLNALAEEVDKLRAELAAGEVGGRSSGATLDRMHRYIAHLNQVFRQSLQGLFADIALLQNLVDEKNIKAARTQLQKLNGRVQDIGQSLRQNVIEKSFKMMEQEYTTQADSM